MRITAIRTLFALCYKRGRNRAKCTAIGSLPPELLILWAQELGSNLGTKVCLKVAFQTSVYRGFKHSLEPQEPLCFIHFVRSHKTATLNWRPQGVEDFERLIVWGKGLKANVVDKLKPGE